MQLLYIATVDSYTNFRPKNSPKGGYLAVRSEPFYDADNETIRIEYTPAKEAGYGGHVVTVKAYDWGENEYADFPSWSVAGTSNEKKYIAIYPTDVQFNPEDSEQVAEYRRLLEVAERMDCNDEELAKDNPFDVVTE